MNPQTDAALVPVKYVGRKAEKQDNVAGTGLIWARGQVHYVPPLIAQKLVKHRDVWGVADEDDLDPAAVGLVVTSETLDPAATLTDEQKKEEGKKDEVPPIELPNLMGMTRPDLLSYAERTFNEKLPANMKKEDMVTQIVALANSRAAGEIQ